MYALPTVAGGKCADIAIGCAGLLLALEGVPTFSEEHAQQLDYIDNLRAVDRRDTEVHQNVFVAFEAGWQVTAYLMGMMEKASGAFIELHSSVSTLARSCVFDICETAEAASVGLNRARASRKAMHF